MFLSGSKFSTPESENGNYVFARFTSAEVSPGLGLEALPAGSGSGLGNLKPKPFKRGQSPIRNDCDLSVTRLLALLAARFLLLYPSVSLLSPSTTRQYRFWMDLDNNPAQMLSRKLESTPNRHPRHDVIPATPPASDLFVVQDRPIQLSFPQAAFPMQPTSNCGCVNQHRLSEKTPEKFVAIDDCLRDCPFDSGGDFLAILFYNIPHEKTDSRTTVTRFLPGLTVVRMANILPLV
ncbi:hypothetical protein FB451DRAFT_1166910 [Mycena latifolia]|nr:hypothetical protein FB451DRAFT_1166910 [Mycena latifolia]